MLMPMCVFVRSCECAWTRCCWVESVSGGKEKDKCSLKIAPGQLVYTVYQQSVPGAKDGGSEGRKEMERKTGSEKRQQMDVKTEKCGKIGENPGRRESKITGK